MAEETTTAEVDTPEAGAEESETQSLLSAEPVEQTESKEEEPVPHLAQETDDLIEAKETAPAERPEHIPDRFWKDDAIDAEGAVKAYTELRKKMDSGKHKAPKDGKYDMESTEGLDVEGEDFAEFLDLAKDEGMSQGMFDRLTKFWLDMTSEQNQQIQYHRDEEMKKLGRNADKVIESMDAWLTRLNSAKVLNNDELSALANASTNAAFISGLDKIRRSYNEPDIPSVGVMEPDNIGMDDIEQMMNDSRYGKDMAYTRQVERKVYELHGEKAGTA